MCKGGSRARFENVIEKVNALSGRARASGSQVVHVHHEGDEGPLQFGSEGWALAGGSLAAAEDIRLRKTMPNAFHGTELHQLMQDRGASRVVIAACKPSSASTPQFVRRHSATASPSHPTRTPPPTAR